MKLYYCLFFIMLYFITIAPQMVKILNKKTRYVENQHIHPKLFNMFFFFSPFCFIFINKIKKQRKIEYMEYRLIRLNKKMHFLSDEEFKEKRNIILYLKLNKLKKKI